MRATTERVIGDRERWLLPRSQTEYPARPVLAEETIHGRRELTFLVLSSMFLVGTCALIALGASRIIDVSAIVAAVNLELDLPIAMAIPIGVIAFVPSFIALAFVCHLFGKRRAVALVIVGFVASAAIAGVLRIADVIDGGDAFAFAVAFAACQLIAHAFFVIAFQLTRGAPFIVRTTFASLIAQIAGWSAFGLALRVVGDQLMTALPPTTIAGLAAGAAAFSFACVFVLSLPAALVARGLAIALRVGREPVDTLDDQHDVPAFARRPAALIVEDDEEPSPYTSGEMRFFRDGDALTD
jgi:hypothetical protein